MALRRLRAAQLTFAQVVDALAALDCRWEPLGPIEGQRGLRTLPHRVEFTFVTDEGPEPVLHQAGTWAYEHDCIPATATAAAFAEDFPPEQGAPRPART
jgi:hypothetical protein